MVTMADRDLDVVVVGAIGVDTNAYVPDGPLGGTDAAFVSVVDVVGQAGGFTARGFAALGRRTAFAGHVGADPWGAMVREALTADGIDGSALVDDPAGTARSVNLVATDGRRHAFYDGRGAGDFVPDLDAAAALIARSRLTMVHLPNWTRRLLPVARARGTTIAVDLQDVRDIDDPYRADFIAGADLLFASAADHGDPLALAAALLDRSPAGVVVVGAGAAGAALARRDGGPIRLVPPAALDLPVVDTNGAGDALAVGFCDAYVLDGLDADRALRRGQLAARWACAQRGRSDSLITRADLDRLERR